MLSQRTSDKDTPEEWAICVLSCRSKHRFQWTVICALLHINKATDLWDTAAIILERIGQLQGVCSLSCIHHARGSANVTSFSARDTCDRINVERYRTSMISWVHPEKSFLNSALSLHGTAPMISDKCLHKDNQFSSVKAGCEVAEAPLSDLRERKQKHESTRPQKMTGAMGRLRASRLRYLPTDGQSWTRMSQSRQSTHDQPVTVKIRDGPSDSDIGRSLTIHNSLYVSMRLCDQ